MIVLESKQVHRWERSTSQKSTSFDQGLRPTNRIRLVTNQVLNHILNYRRLLCVPLPTTSENPFKKEPKFSLITLCSQRMDFIHFSSTSTTTVSRTLVLPLVVLLFVLYTLPFSVLLTPPYLTFGTSMTWTSDGTTICRGVYLE